MSEENKKKAQYYKKKNCSGEKVNFKSKQLPGKKENRIGPHITYAKCFISDTQSEKV